LPRFFHHASDADALKRGGIVIASGLRYEPSFAVSQSRVPLCRRLFNY